jgi:hypothetical protein
MMLCDPEHDQPQRGGSSLRDQGHDHPSAMGDCAIQDTINQHLAMSGGPAARSNAIQHDQPASGHERWAGCAI